MTCPQSSMSVNIMSLREYVEDQINEGFHMLGLPEYMQEGIKRWVLDGIPGGNFLMALMHNDLIEAFLRADNINVEQMRDWVSFLYNYIPANCHGSKEKVAAWEGLKEQSTDTASEPEKGGECNA